MATRVLHKLGHCTALLSWKSKYNQDIQRNQLNEKNVHQTIEDPFKSIVIKRTNVDQRRSAARVEQRRLFNSVLSSNFQVF
jgi:hypothetical protein